MKRADRALTYPTELGDFDALVLVASFDVDPSGCWLWSGATANGYGVMRIDGQLYQAHRLVWVQVNGPVDPDLDIDHGCRVKLCVNPDHLEAVSHAENIRRGLASIRAAA